MYFFVNHSWQLIQKLEMYCGLWPFENRLKTHLTRAVFILVLVAAILPIAARMNKEWGVNFHIATENLGSIMIILAVLIKIMIVVIHNKERQIIYEQINYHFRIITDEEEAFLLSTFSEYGLKFCIKYLIIHFTLFTIFYISPVAVTIWKYLKYGSEIEKLFPYYADHIFIDENEYYAVIVLLEIVACPFGGIINCAYDFGYIMNVRHLCVLFKILKMRLREASGFLEEFEWNMLDFTTANNKAYELIIKAIDLHNEALKMVPLIEKTYTSCLFIVLLENAFTFSGVSYLFLVSLNHPLNLIRYLTFGIMLFLHFCLHFLAGQLIIDSSSSISKACYKVKWYLASTKTRKLLTIMMLRSSRPCKITGGRLFIISMETCCKMMKAGFSYLSLFTQRTT